MYIGKILALVPLSIFSGPWQDWKDSIVDGIENMIKGWLSGGITFCIENIISFLVDGLGSDVTGISGIVRSYLTSSPQGINPGVWGAVKSLSDDVVVPVATTIVAIISVYDLYQMVVVSNCMHDFDSSIFIRWIIKTNVGLIIVSNVFYITEEIFALGSRISLRSYGWMASFVGSGTTVGPELQKALMEYSIPELAGILILAFITMLAVFFLFVMIIVVLLSRVIEAMMYLGVAPIPVATMLNNETKGMGDSWIRGVLAVAFQSFFIIIALTFFGSMFTGVVNDMVTGKNIMWNMLLVCGYSVAIIFTVLRSGQISKSMFGAH